MILNCFVYYTQIYNIWLKNGQHACFGFLTQYIIYNILTVLNLRKIWKNGKAKFLCTNKKNPIRFYVHLNQKERKKDNFFLLLYAVLRQYFYVKINKEYIESKDS